MCADDLIHLANESIQKSMCLYHELIDVSTVYTNESIHVSNELIKESMCL